MCGRRKCFIVEDRDDRGKTEDAKGRGLPESRERSGQGPRAETDNGMHENQRRRRKEIMTMRKRGIGGLCLLLALALVLGLGVSAALAEGWTCPNCGQAGNTGNFCFNCGAPRPGEGEPAAEP